MRKIGIVGTLGLALIIASLSVMMVAQGSSHREAPLISMDPTVDTTDVYFFRSPDQPDTVTIIGNWLPFEEPAGGPNFFTFDDNVLYALRIDNDGDAVEDIVYEFRFDTEVQNPNTFLYNTGPITSLDDADWNRRQHYTVTRVDAGGRHTLGTNLMTPPANIGPTSTPDYESLAEMAVHDLSGGSSVFAGQRDDPFFVDLGGTFDLLTIRELPGDQGGGVDGLNGYNVHSIALQVPITDITSDGTMPTELTDEASVVGVWATSHRPRVNVLSDTGQAPEGGSSVVHLFEGFNFLTYQGATGPVEQALADIDDLSVACRFNNDDKTWDCYDPDAPGSINTLTTVETNDVLVIWVGTEQDWMIDAWVQVSRLAMPLVNELVIPIGKKDLWNATELTPTSDGQFLQYVTDPELAAIMNLLYNLGAPTTNRADLVAIFLTGIPGVTQPPNVVASEQMRLNVAVPPSENENPLGVLGGDNAGFPNGRRLADDVTDIELKAVCGVTYQIFVDPAYPVNELCDNLGDGVDANDLPFMDAFPYMSTPHQGFDHLHDHSDPGSPLTTAAMGGGIGGGLLMAGAIVGAILLKKRSKQETETEIAE